MQIISSDAPSVNTQNSPQSLLDHALAYAAIGWPVFPCHTPLTSPGWACTCEVWRRKKVSADFDCQHAGKHPRTKNGLDDATTDPEQIRDWWRRWPSANIGINCGKAGLLVVDLDTYRDNYQGDDLELDEETVTALSGGGGAHLFYRLEDGDQFGNSNKNLPNGIDIRGHGGYVIVAPSLHESGQLYQWENDYAPWDKPIAPIPPKLRALLGQQIERAQAQLIFDTTKKFDRHATRYGAKAIENQCALVAKSANGMRNNTLNTAAFSLGRLVAGGEIDGDYAHAELLSAARVVGLTDDEAERTIQSGMGAGKMEPKVAPRKDAVTLPSSEDAQFNLLEYRPEDGGILDCWMDLFGGEWLYVTGYESWFGWRATHWEKDDQLGIQRQIQTLMDAINRAATGLLLEALERLGDAAKDEREMCQREVDRIRAYVAATKRTRGRVASIESMAQAQRAVAVAQLDAGNLLNLRNGTLDLNTLLLHPHSKENHLTYCLPYDYDETATCPRYEQFLQEVLVAEEPDANGGWMTDTELCMLFQELTGYSLTTDSKYEVMTWLSGEGGNGKSVAITIIQRLLGQLCSSIDFQTIGLPGNYDLSDIPGRRVIFSTESERGGKVAEGYIKKIVSGEQVKARPIYGKPFEFAPVAKVWWAMNDKPIIKDTGNSIWRRMKLIPFNRTFNDNDKDPDLIPKLEAELSGILNFALDGLRRLRQRGKLPESAAVNKAIKEYRQETNAVAQWMDEKTTALAEPKTLAGELYDDYQKWCKASGREAFNSTNFGKELKRLRVAYKANARVGNRVGNCYALGLLFPAL